MWPKEKKVTKRIDTVAAAFASSLRTIQANKVNRAVAIRTAPKALRTCTASASTGFCAARKRIGTAATSSG